MMRRLSKLRAMRFPQRYKRSAKRRIIKPMNLKEIMTGDATTDPQAQNLINPSKIDTNSTRPPGFWKSLILDVVTVGSAALFGYCYYRYLTQGLSVWILLAAVTFFGVMFVMEAFLARGA